MSEEENTAEIKIQNDDGTTTAIPKGLCPKCYLKDPENPQMHNKLIFRAKSPVMGYYTSDFDKKTGLLKSGARRHEIEVLEIWQCAARCEMCNVACGHRQQILKDGADGPEDTVPERAYRQASRPE